MLRKFCILASATLVVSGCHRQPAAPDSLPASFAVQRLSGEHLTAAQMRGSPWVVNFWLPT